ncbi:hypothetical protein BWD12_16210 [Leptospira santarosai serovar Bananal]|nr:hypothetical protein BV917_10795 [Leptospira santarosai serovar Guaricura]OLY65285.1 hypothetical protein BWD11_05160 [Leptospira santarosai serovar Grippotyphosa]ONF77365.1 hypothetical protein BWD12_16210 [Leptospira santarosai serovar Bananal]
MSFRSAAFGYLTPDGSFDRGAFGNSAKRFLRGAFQALFLTLQGAVPLSFFWNRFLYRTHGNLVPRNCFIENSRT